MEVIQKALIFAIKHHDGQTRKNKNVPFVVHPIMVAINCARNGLSDDEIAAAILHDVVEDTSVTVFELRNHFNENICKIVDSLTNRTNKKEKYLNSIRYNEYSVRCIKTADRIHNLSESEDMGPGWREKYIRDTIEYIVPASKDTPFYFSLLEVIEKIKLTLEERE